MKVSRLFVAAVAMMIALSAQAIETRFNTTGSWTNAANWSAGVPGATDLARLQNPAAADITSAEVIGGLNFRGDTVLGTSIININSGGSLTSDGTQFAGVNRVGSDGDATLNINDGGAASFSGTSFFEVGENSGDAGYVNVNSGGALTVSQATKLGADAACVGAVTINGGTATFNNNLAIGFSAGSTGQVTLNSGVVNVSGGQIRMADDNATAVGTFTMAGGTLNHTGSDVLVARKGTATFTQSGGTINGAGFILGNMAGGNGTMNVSGGSNSLSGSITLGRVDGATGTLNMSGGFMDASSLLVGNEAGSDGTFTLTGKDTYVKVGTLSMGAAGADVNSMIVVNDGLLQFSALVADGNSANESFAMSGGVLQMRHLTSPDIVNEIDALITAGVFTWSIAAEDSLAATYDVADATRTWVNGDGVTLYANESGTNYSFIWAEAIPEPATVGMMGIGALITLMVRRIRRV
ncbi:MAG: PEP-CTERM sorting domain-containing protein [Verrucomicrobia bacterium]|nr:PEP-CTERM sorting domain-containing protein [Verrucomicrobiota bacterium]